jgi:uncharacterized protein (TIGR02452 family)
MTAVESPAVDKNHHLVTSRRLSATDDELPVGCSFSRQWLIHVGHDTLQIAEEGKYVNRHGDKVPVAEAYQHALANSKHYHSSHVFSTINLPTSPNFEATEFHVCYGSSLQVASKLQLELLKAHQDIEIEIGILNSASGKNPEKFLRGTLSQEEGICRASFLYPCLAQYKNKPHHFYYVNLKPKYEESSSTCAIYCSRVPVIREDSRKAELLDKPHFFSIVSIPAPNAFVLGSDDEEQTIPKAQEPGADGRNESYDSMTIDAAMRDRIFRALSIFAEQGCTDLVLCAFGCGVHGNSPEKIATCFRDIILNELKGRFRVVAFAIQPSRHSSYEAFVDVFGEK